MRNLFTNMCLCHQAV